MLRWAAAAAAAVALGGGVTVWEGGGVTVLCEGGGVTPAHGGAGTMSIMPLVSCWSRAMLHEDALPCTTPPWCCSAPMGVGVGDGPGGLELMK